MTIPFQDLRPALAKIRIPIDQALDRVRDRGIFLNGPEVELFCEEWSEYCGMDYTVACASGTDALMLAMRARSLNGWEHVAIPANTCEFTMTGLEMGGAELSFFDVDERGYCNSQNVVPVLLYGRQWHPYSDGFGAIFDACQAHGWKPPKKSIACFSGYPTKNLGSFGDCGWVTTNDAKERDYMTKITKSFHSRMSEINAAVLRTKLPHLDRWNAERAAIAEMYYNELPNWAEPACRPGEPTNHHIFAVLVDRRDELKAHLEANGIQTKVHYPEPLAELPGARRWANMTLSLPMWCGLTPKQVQEVCDNIRSFR